LTSRPTGQNFFARPRGASVAQALAELKTRASGKRWRAGG
jgi:hypothetical protein